MRTDNNPIGRLIEQFQNLMFMANGYHHSTIGYMSDLNNISRAGLRGLLPRNYVGTNIVRGDRRRRQRSPRSRSWPASTSRRSRPASPEPVETPEPDAARREALRDEGSVAAHLHGGLPDREHAARRLAGLRGHRRRPRPGPHQPPLHEAGQGGQAGGAGHELRRVPRREVPDGHDSSSASRSRARPAPTAREGDLGRDRRGWSPTASPPRNWRRSSSARAPTSSAACDGNGGLAEQLA